jgi:hypothetical protein
MGMNYRPLIFILISAVALTALFVVLKPAPESPIQQEPTVNRGKTTAAPERSAYRFELVIEGGALASGPRRIEVQQGSAIEIKVITDHADELHLHGYDLKLQLTAGEPATLAFSADHSGRFGLELHHSHGEIATLEVMPTP